MKSITGHRSCIAALGRRWCAVGAVVLLQQSFPLQTRHGLTRCAPGQTWPCTGGSGASELLLVLDDLGRLTRPHHQRERVHERLRSPFAAAGAFVIHPELGEVQRPKVGGGRRLECVDAQRGRHQAAVDVVQLGVLLVGVALEDWVQERQGGGRAGEGGKGGGEERLLLEGVQQGLQVGSGAVGRVPGVGGHHLRGLHRDGAGQVGRARGVTVSGDHQLTEREHEIHILAQKNPPAPNL